VIPFVKVRLGAYVPDHLSDNPGNLASYSLPPHLRPQTSAVQPNRADRRKARRR
jgi:hypothetical protein